MLEQILDFIHNYFVKEVYRGKFKISSNTLDVDFLQYGQYFKIVGSVFNDGVWQYPGWLKDGVLVDEERKLILTEDGKAILTSTPNSVMADEEFVGEIWAMAVPPTVIALVNEITAWIEKYGDVMNSPFQSESFGGYSYSKGSGGSSNSNNSSSNAADWRKVFGSRLNAYRKINNEFVVKRYKNEFIN